MLRLAPCAEPTCCGPAAAPLLTSSRRRGPLRCRASSSAQWPQGQQGAGLDRRGLLRAAAGCALLVAAPAACAAELDLDIAHASASGFVSWWKSRRTLNGGAKLLAPIYVAQRRLREAAQQLSTADALSPEAAKEVLQLVRASSLNCYMFEALEDDTIETKASLLTQKLELSDPCTFRIVLKNVVSLEPAETQQQAREKMDALVLSYQKLDAYLDMAREGNPDMLPRARDQLAATQQIAADIESFVKTTLGV